MNMGDVPKLFKMNIRGHTCQKGRNTASWTKNKNSKPRMEVYILKTD